MGSMDSMIEIFNNFIKEINDLPDSFVESISESMIDDLFIVPIKASVGINTVWDGIDNSRLYKRYTKDIALSEYNNGVKELNELINSLDINPKKKQIISRITNEILDTILAGINTYHFTDATIYVEKCHENAKIPTFAHYADAGADVYAIEDITIQPRSTVLIPTGLRMAIPYGWMVSVRPRSGMSLKTNIRISNAPGTIDSGYLSPIGIIVTNIGDEPYDIHVGDRIAQFIVEKKYEIDFVECDNVLNYNSVDNRENSNGASGFGSTGT